MKCNLLRRFYIFRLFEFRKVTQELIRTSKLPKLGANVCCCWGVTVPKGGLPFVLHQLSHVMSN